MRLKLTLEAGSSVTDLLVDADATARVGALADQMAHVSATTGAVVTGTGHTLELLAPQRGELDPNQLLADSGVRSGSAVRVVPLDDRFGVSKAVDASALLRVVDGPDSGKEFPIPSGTSVIGRDRGCDIQLNDPLVSRQHARIHVSDVIELVDLGSANGILIGDESSDRVTVGPSDHIRLGDTVVAITLLATGYSGSPSPVIAFNRSPIVDPSFRADPLKAPQPPELPRSQRFPIIPLFAPAIMGLVIYLSTHALTSLIFVAMSPLMMIGNVVEGRHATRRGYRAAVEQFRTDTSDLAAEVRDLQSTEVTRRLTEHPSASECATFATSLSSSLWSRWSDLPRFLELRLGIGTQPSVVHVELPQGNQTNRSLWKELRDALEPMTFVHSVPVVAKLGESGGVGMAGPRPETLAAARSLVVQACSLHSPSDLILAGFASSRTAGEWEWIKWFPHCASGRGGIQAFPLASSQAGCTALISELEALIESREEDKTTGTTVRSPSVLCVVEDDAPVERSRLVGIVARGDAVGVHTVWIAPERSKLPAACRTFIETVPNSGDVAAGFVQLGETVRPLVPDVISESDALAVAKHLSPVTDSSAVEGDETDLPRAVSLISLLGQDVAETPQGMIDRWTESRSLLSGPFGVDGKARRPGTLRAVVGMSSVGPQVLDLRANGPHALVGGTTGSGKSELLQSWILGMATANSPQRVTFLLVDYKGGSAFSECVHLPHTVGLVTDLSPHLVRRALTSLKAELRHREHVLRKRGAKDLLELEKTGDPDTPPSLIIVVDEFAALVTEVPDFVDGVVDVAQRGRSLGLHLILATQRPAGVIKDNLRANTNLRIALRMADEADSTDVLGTKDAATFDPSLPGRAISRTGPSKLIHFQAAYSGGWTTVKESPARIRLETFGFAPARAFDMPGQDDLPSVDPGPTDIQRLVTIARAASSTAELPEPRKPWLPELAHAYDLAKLPTPRRDESLVFGVVDDPENQRQPTVAFNPDQDGNFAVYGTGNSGKTTFLKTIALASGFTIRGGPCHVYGLDFGARGLQALEDLPHVGSVIPGTDHERLIRLLTMLRTTLDERAVRYAKVGAGTITSYRRLAGAPDEARILLLVDGIGAFRSAYEGTEQARWFENFLSIASDGRPVGIHVVVAGDRPGAMPSRLNALVQRRLVLRLAEPNDYAFLGVPGDVLLQGTPPGRGLLIESEVQVGVLGGSADGVEQARAIAAFAASMRNAGAKEAPPIEALAEIVPLKDLPNEVDGLPAVGLSGVTLAPVGIDPHGTFTIAGPPGSGRTTAVRTVIEAIRRNNAATRFFYFGQKRSPLASLPWEGSALDVDGAAKLAGDLPLLIGEVGGEVPPSVVVIENISDFVGTPADLALQQLVKTAVAGGHFVLSDGDAVALNGAQPLIVGSRSSRTGIALQPEQSDGAMFRTQFPRLKKSEFPVGRGLYVGRGGQVTTIQVALC